MALKTAITFDFFRVSFFPNDGSILFSMFLVFLYPLQCRFQLRNFLLSLHLGNSLNDFDFAFFDGCDIPIMDANTSWLHPFALRARRK